MSEHSKLIPKILVVGHRKDFLIDLRSILKEKINADFMEARTIMQALLFAGKQELSMVIADLQIPGINADDFISKLFSQKSNHHLTLIFVAEDKNDFQGITAKTKGVVDFIHKPLQPETIVSKVHAHINLYIERKNSEKNQKKIKENNVTKAN